MKDLKQIVEGKVKENAQGIYDASIRGRKERGAERKFKKQIVQDIVEETCAQEYKVDMYFDQACLNIDFTKFEYSGEENG